MAFTRTWNAAYEALPTDNNYMYEVDDYIRESRVDVRERMEIEHTWDGTASDGIHKNLNTLLTKTQADSPYTVTAANLNGFVIFINTGASGEIIFTLPAGATGYKARAIVTAAQYLQLLCNGTEKIRFGAVQTAAGGYVRSNTVGNVIEIVWSGTEWVITYLGGDAWKYDE